MSRNGYSRTQSTTKYHRANKMKAPVPKLLPPSPANVVPVGSPEALAGIERVKAANKNWRSEGFNYKNRPSRRPYAVGIEEFQRRKKEARDV